MAAQHTDWTREGQSLARNSYCKIAVKTADNTDFTDGIGRSLCADDRAFDRHLMWNVARASRLQVRAASRRQFQTHAPGRCSNPQPGRPRYDIRFSPQPLKSTSAFSSPGRSRAKTG